MKIIKIDKRELSKLSYPKADALKTKVKMRFRSLKLKAAVINNDENSIYDITIRSLSRGLFKVKTKVMVSGKKYAILEGGHIIPIKAITEIK